MAADKRILDDMARMANSAFGAVTGMRGEVEAMIRQRFERLLAELDIVTRDDLDAVSELAAKSRNVEEDILIRLAGLEIRLGKIEAALGLKTSVGGLKAKPAATDVPKPPRQRSAQKTTTRNKPVASKDKKSG